MSDHHNEDRTARSRIGWKITAMICGGILLVGAGIIAYIFTTEPTATRVEGTRKSAMLVEVAEVESGMFRPTIVAMGTVRPARDIILRPRVDGEIVSLSESFTPGGFVEKGDNLLRLDPSDYRNILQQRKSELHQAEANLEIEMGRQNVARREYDLFEEELSPDNRALVLRKPQLNAARARVESARAAVAQAGLELNRTEIAAPFDAHILGRNVNVGSQVSAGDNLGRLAGLNTYWLEATVPLAKLRWLSLPENPGEKGSEVMVRNRTAWPKGAVRIGYLHRIIGELEGETRLARVLVTIDDPLARSPDSAGLPPLIIGSFLEARITGRETPEVARLNRDYVRENDRVWVMEEDKLEIKDVDIVFRDAEYAYIGNGLERDDLVVTTNLATVVEGAGLRLREDNATVENIPAGDPG